jgi:DNA polymerase elongation subunit (family B)
MLTIDYEDGTSEEQSAAEIWQMIFDSNNTLILSANGTIFRSDQEGVIPGLLSRWYSDRKVMQKKLKESATQADREYWDKRQLVRKILLNSAYGALLNEHCRFYDKRLGQSVTLTGRQIVRHMMSTINETVTGEYSHEGKAIIYGDTDSCYFTAFPALSQQIKNGELEWNKETCIALYDSIAEQANLSFPAFMERAFHCPRKNGEIIKAGRELIGDRAIFITKKRYAINIFDKEGKRLDNNGEMGKIKAMGLDLKRSDTPKYVQEFLMSVLKLTLAGKKQEEIAEAIKEFKLKLAEQASWTKGSPKSANSLTSYQELENNSSTGKANMPGHVRAALNWNRLRNMHSDNYSIKIVDGMKIVVCKLKPNALNFTSVAYPVDELRLPQWFTDLPFDDLAMEETLVDKKIENLLGVLDWDLRSKTDTNSTFNDLFSFG